MKLIALATLAVGIAISGCDSSEQVRINEAKLQLEKERAAVVRHQEKYRQMHKGKDSQQNQQKP